MKCSREISSCKSVWQRFSTKSPVPRRCGLCPLIKSKFETLSMGMLYRVRFLYEEKPLVSSFILPDYALKAYRRTEIAGSRILELRSGFFV